MDKNDTATGQDTASMDWNKVVQEFWLPLFKPWSGVFQSSEAEDHGQFNQGRTVDSLQATVRMWQAMTGAMGEPLAFEHFQKATEVTPDIALGFAQTCLQSFISLQARAGEWIQSRASSLSADEVQELDRVLIKELTETYEKEFSKYLKVPQVGLGRFHQERSLHATDKYNTFQLVLLEFLHMLYLPVERSLKSLQEKMAEMAEAGPLDEKPKTYYNLWIKLLEGEYMELFQQPEFADLMGKTLGALNEFVGARQAVIDDVLKQLNIPTNQDMDELSKEIYLLKKRVRALENK
ncbi:MAG: class III poly(R)-hydroxyalkanoic acid synthase PhaE subunit [Desulforhopalus sp.]|jgi:class III poly(R)-hydroxyalkanoic acid synthase PhaE subunit